MALLFLITGASGSGKTTLCASVIRKYPNQITRVVTATSRSPRDGEIHGRDYYFFSRHEFESKIAAGDFYEYATVYQNLYGSLKSEICEKLSKGIDLILSIDVQGVKNFKEAADKDSFLKDRIVCLFINVQDMNELYRRLKERGKDSEAVIQERLKVALIENQHHSLCDYVIHSRSKENDLQSFENIYRMECSKHLKR